MLRVCVALLVTERIGSLHLPCSSQMTAGGNVFVGVGTLHRTAMGDIEDSCRARHRLAVAQLTEVVGRLYIVGCRIGSG